MTEKERAKLLKRLDALPPWPWKKKQKDSYIDWSTKLLYEIAKGKPSE